MMRKFILFLCALFLVGGGLAQAQRIPTLEFFYGEECPHCHEEMEWFPEIQEMYPDLRIEKYEVWHDAQNKALWRERLAELGHKPMGVPTNIIGETVIVGFVPAKIRDALARQYGEPAQECAPENIGKEPCANSWEKYLSFPWPLMALTLGLIDGFNPCAMWSLFVLLGFLLALESKKKRWMIGGVFIGVSGLIYFGALLTYLLGFSEISALAAGGVMTWIFRAVGALALGTGGVVLWSVRRAQVECQVRSGESRKKFSEKLQQILERKNLWLVLLGVSGLAISVNAVELLCSFAIPTTFTASLVSANLGWTEKIAALVLYDIMYILDDLVVFLIAMWTFSLKVFSPRLVQISHLIGGILLFLIGLALLFDPGMMTRILG
ncbi:MAG: hypothetical protein K9M51_00125 [Candidatus Gracilibacteria bacterium]|nr:hypothetical protein [Candidatus Gracilibacteria bacterium]